MTKKISFFYKITCSTIIGTPNNSYKINVNWSIFVIFTVVFKVDQSI